jgi:uncharacterized protein YjdB
MMNSIAPDATSRVTIVIAALACVALAAGPYPTSAQRGPRPAPPSGREIAERARAAKLDRENTGVGEFQGKRISLVPADPSGVRSAAELEAGQVIGVMENEVAGDETGLPPGRYNLFLAKLADGWHVYAESGGEIVTEAIRVQIEQVADGNPGSKKPVFRAKGWGWTQTCTVRYTPVYTWTASGYQLTGYQASTYCYWVWVAPPPPPAASISIVPATLALVDAQTAQLAAVAKDTSGNEIAGKAFAWSSSNPGVASVTSTGLVTGLAAGTATITATADGKSATAVVTVTMRPVGSVVVSPATLSLDLGSTAQLTATVKDASGAVLPRPVSWTTSNAFAVTVSAAGQIQAAGSGTATITATAEGKSGAAQVTVPRAITYSITYSLRFDW